MTRSKPYGVLLVAGLRTHQENYSFFFNADPRCRLVAVTDEADVSEYRADLNRRFAQEMNLPYIPDLDEALRRDDVDIVSVCAEHERRGRVAVKCAMAGKKLYLHKPKTCSVKDADAVVSAVESAGVKTQVFSFVHNSWAQTAKRAVESDAVGEIIAIHCDVMFAKGYAGTAPLGKHREQNPHPQRFTFIDSKRELRATGVYSVGLVRWLTGAEAKTVFGVTENYFFKEHFHNDVEDFGMLALNLEGAITATIAGGRIGYMSHPSSGPMKIYIVGKKGLMTVDAHKPRVEVCADEPSWTPPPVNPKDPMSFWNSTYRDTKPKGNWITVDWGVGKTNDASHFIDCIESDRKSEVSAKDGAAQVEVLMAGYVSAASGEVVALPLPR